MDPNSAATTPRSTEIYTYSNPRHQEFSFPASIIQYLIRHPQTSSMYDKLIKTCKWFYFQNKLTLKGKIVKTTFKNDDYYPEDIEIMENLLEWNIDNPNVIYRVEKIKVKYSGSDECTTVIQDGIYKITEFTDSSIKLIEEDPGSELDDDDIEEDFDSDLEDDDDF